MRNFYLFCALLALCWSNSAWGQSSPSFFTGIPGGSTANANLCGTTYLSGNTLTIHTEHSGTAPIIRLQLALDPGGNNGFTTSSGIPSSYHCLNIAVTLSQIASGTEVQPGVRVYFQHISSPNFYSVNWVIDISQVSGSPKPISFGDNYYYTARCSTGSGGSAFSQPYYFTLPVLAPTNFNTNASTNQISFTNANPAPNDYLTAARIHITNTNTGWTLCNGFSNPNIVNSTLLSPYNIYTYPTTLSAGTYYYTVRQASNNSVGMWSSPNSFTVAPPCALAVTATATPADYQQQNGSAQANATGTSNTITYSWTGTRSGASISNLPAGTYIVTATASGCTNSTSSCVVTQNPVVCNLEVTATPTDCSANGVADGSIETNVTGAQGSGSPTYTWTGGASGANPISLAANTYTVTVHDGANCTATTTAVVSEPPPAVCTLAIDSVTTTAASSATAHDGTIDVIISGGQGAETYTWAGGSGASGANPTNLAAGTYTVVVSEGTCTTSQSIVVAVAPPTPCSLTIVSATSTPASNATTNNGTITITIGGGATNPTYVWTNSNATIANPTGLAAGTYTVTVSAGATCSTSTSVVVSATPSSTCTLAIASAASTPPSSNTANDGTVTITISGATNATYAWANSTATTATRTGLPVGTYTVTVSAGATCTKTASVNLTTACDITTGKVLDIAFSGNSNDASGFSNDATLNGGITYTTDRFGNQDAAILLDGVDDYAKINPAASLELSNAGSVVVWVKPTGFYTGTCQSNAIICNDHDFRTGRFVMGYQDQFYDHDCFTNSPNNNQFFFFPPENTVNTNWTASAKDPNFVIPNQWYMVAATFDQQETKLFVNGVLVASQINATGISASTFPILIGKMDNSGYPYWLKGAIDDVIMYDRVLSQSQITALYSLPNAAFTSIATNSTVNFTNTSTNATTYAWNFGNGQTSTQQNPSVAYAATGTYTVTLTVSNGCTATTTTQVVTVTANPVINNAHYAINLPSQISCGSTGGCIPIIATTAVSNVSAYYIDLAIVGNITTSTPLLNSAVVPNGTIFTNTLSNGHLAIGISLNSLQSINAAIGDTIACIPFVFNNAIPNQTISVSGTVEEEYLSTNSVVDTIAPTISTITGSAIVNGAIFYWNDNARPLYNTNSPFTAMTTNGAVGNTLFSANSDSTGHFAINTQNATHLNFTHSSNAAFGMPVIGSFDAYLAGQLAVYDTTSHSIFKILAMDANADGRITPIDRTLLQQRSVGLLAHFSGGDWRFFDASLLTNPAFQPSNAYPFNGSNNGFSRDNVPTNLVKAPQTLASNANTSCTPTSMQFVGVLVGDVDGSYTNANTAYRNPSAGTVTIDIQNAQRDTAGDYIVPVYSSLPNNTALDLRFNTNNILSITPQVFNNNSFILVSNIVGNSTLIGATSTTANGVSSNCPILLLKIATNNTPLTPAMFGDNTSMNAYLNGSTSTIIFSASTAACFTNTNTQTSEKASLLIYPNPVTDQITVVNTGSASIKLISISNTLGQVLATTTDTTVSMPYPAGIYFVQVRLSDNTLQIRKIMVE